MNKEDRRAFALGKDKIYAAAANTDSRKSRQALSRSIPPQLRQKVIDRNGDGRCRLCGQPVAPEEIHIDHIQSVADGGLTELSNLQVTCRHCNLKKGSGRTRSTVAHIPAKQRASRRRSA